MTDYLLLLRDEPSEYFDHISPEEMQAVIARYSAWRDQLEERGQLVGSNKLTDGAGRVMRRIDDKVRILDGPFSEAKEIVGGYFMIRAESYEAAAQIAGDCPHLDFGSVEIREIELH